MSPLSEALVTMSCAAIWLTLIKIAVCLEQIARKLENR